MQPTHLDLFSGIGGFALAAQWAGFRTIGFCEIDKYACRVLAHRFPGVTNHGDIRNLQPAYADLVTGGFPCQDISISGKGAGLNGERSGLWRELFRVIRAIRPKFILVENVGALTFRGLGSILGDLAGIGFDSEWYCIPASWIGAPHRRKRIWIVAYPNGFGCGCTPLGFNPVRLVKREIAEAFRVPFLSESPVCGMDDGLPNRVDRVRGLSNAIVPQVAYEILREIRKLI